MVDFVKWSFYKVAQIYTVTKIWMRLNIFLYVKWQPVFLFLYIACSYSLDFLTDSAGLCKWKKLSFVYHCVLQMFSAFCLLCSTFVFSYWFCFGLVLQQRNVNILSGRFGRVPLYLWVVCLILQSLPHYNQSIHSWFYLKDTHTHTLIHL